MKHLIVREYVNFFKVKVLFLKSFKMVAIAIGSVKQGKRRMNKI